MKNVHEQIGQNSREARSGLTLQTNWKIRSVVTDEVDNELVSEVGDVAETVWFELEERGADGDSNR